MNDLSVVSERIGVDPESRKYVGLRMLASVLRIIAVLILVAEAISAVIALSDGHFAAIDGGILGGSILTALMVLAFAALIQVVIDIEENTRK